MISIEAYRAAIGSYYNRAKYLSCQIDQLLNTCPCRNYKDVTFIHWGFGNLNFCISVIELIYDVSFTKLLQLIVDGDVELNPGPTNMNTPGGRKLKKKTWNFTPNKLDFTPSVDNRFLNQSEPINLSSIKPWSQICQKSTKITQCKYLHDLNSKVSLIQADIVNLEVDAIVNAAKPCLTGGGGIDGKIHKTAGIQLKQKCEQLPLIKPDVRCPTGECKVTDTLKCKLKCDFVFHTVGPDLRDKNLSDIHEQQLKNCYQNCLDNMLQYNVKSIVFPCISTGVYEFPNKIAAEIALNTIRSWLEIHHSQIDRVILCTFEPDDFDDYEKLMTTYFHVSDETIPDLPNKVVTDEIPTDNPEYEVPTCSTSNANLSDTSTRSSNDSSSVVIDNVQPPTEYRALNINYSLISDNTINRKPYAKLQNHLVNICFFNSCLQALYSLDIFHTYLEQTPLVHPVIDKLKVLFNQMRNLNNEVLTYVHMYHMRQYFADYSPLQQYDAEGCLRTILQICYPDVQKAYSDNIFGITKFDSQFKFCITYNECTECSSCQKTKNDIDNHYM